MSVSSEIAPTDLAAEDLRQYQGHWLAFSPDGHRLIASCLTLKGLDVLVQAMGEDPAEVLLHKVPDADAIRSGSELS
jgi:hypothetical protein